MRLSFAVLTTLSIMATALPAVGQDVPTEVGQCVETTIEEIGSRLERVPDSGDAVVYANGIYGVSYDTIPGLRNSAVGDPVQLCLTLIPEGCPAGDERGRFYAATNLKNNETWELPDAAHMCGGA